MLTVKRVQTAQLPGGGAPKTGVHPMHVQKLSETAVKPSKVKGIEGCPMKSVVATVGTSDFERFLNFHWPYDEKGNQILSWLQAAVGTSGPTNTPADVKKLPDRERDACAKALHRAEGFAALPFMSATGCNTLEEFAAHLEAKAAEDSNFKGYRLDDIIGMAPFAEYLGYADPAPPKEWIDQQMALAKENKPNKLNDYMPAVGNILLPKRAQEMIESGELPRDWRKTPWAGSGGKGGSGGGADPFADADTGFDEAGGAGDKGSGGSGSGGSGASSGGAGIPDEEW